MTKAHLLSTLPFLFLLGTQHAHAQVGTAAGQGVLERSDGPGEPIAFQPKHAFAYTEGSGATKATWLVLTEKEPPVKAWQGAKDPDEARQRWSAEEKASFLAVKLDDKMEIDLYFSSTGTGLTTSMVSSWNGLKSLDIQLTSKTGKRLQGELHGGKGACGDNEYCDQKSDYSFDVTLQ